MSDHTTISLSPRQERFVAASLKDGNATQAHLRAGYSRHGAQPSTSRRLRDLRIATAIAAGRQRIDLEKAHQAQRAGIVELRVVSNHSKPVQPVTLKHGRLRLGRGKARQVQRAGIVGLKLPNHSKPLHPVTLKHGRLRLGREEARQVPRAGIVGLTLPNHSKPLHPVTLKPGKLRALAALTRTPAARPCRDLRHHQQSARHDQVVGRHERQPHHRRVCMACAAAFSSQYGPHDSSR